MEPGSRPAADEFLAHFRGHFWPSISWRLMAHGCRSSLHFIADLSKTCGLAFFEYVTTPKRAAVLPEVPSLGEFQSEFRPSETSHGLLAPAGTPRPVLDQISREVARVLELPDIRERLQSINYVIAPSAPEAYDKIVHEQMQMISILVVAAGLRAK